jgi:hypothetical protein
MTDFQNEPVEDGTNDATSRERLAGIVAQVRADLSLGHSHDARDLLSQRLTDAGIELSPDDFAAVVADLTA